MTNQKPKVKILVISGGYSTEREVSIKTGENIFSSLINQGIEASSLVLSGEKSDVLEEVLNAIKDKKMI
jgi:D-alanine-D-alanine ligase-like ATP-grasp enzyme